MKWFKKDKSPDKPAKPDYVKVLDTESQTIISIPASELAPFMVEAQVDGVEGTVWVDARELHPSDYKHPPFSEDIRDLLWEIKASIDEFYCLPLEEWEDGFRRDTNPEQEIGIWLHLARLYRRLTTTRDLSLEQRQDYFRLLVTCMNSPAEHVLKVFSPSAISIVEAQNVIDEFFGRRLKE
jgi:hypothetical protein